MNVKRETMARVNFTLFLLGLNPIDNINEKITKESVLKKLQETNPNLVIKGSYFEGIYRKLKGDHYD